jgi:hypothetical protein
VLNNNFLLVLLCTEVDSYGPIGSKHCLFLVLYQQGEPRWLLAEVGSGNTVKIHAMLVETNHFFDFCYSMLDLLGFQPYLLHFFSTQLLHGRKSAVCQTVARRISCCKETRPAYKKKPRQMFKFLKFITSCTNPSWSARNQLPGYHRTTNCSKTQIIFNTSFIQKFVVDDRGN